TFTFNDDIQGTGAVNLAAIISGGRATGRRLCEQKVVIYGSGTAGIGIADQLFGALLGDGLTKTEATDRIFCLDSDGLLLKDQRPLGAPRRRYARSPSDVAGWRRDAEGAITLLEVVRQVAPTVLIGTSGRRGAFSEAVVRQMASTCARPIILPMSNPTHLAEATPAELLEWTDGAALVATGSPFGPVRRGRCLYQIAQANNALVFPGLGLGALVARASRVTDSMLRAAAHAVADAVDATTPGSPLLPPIDALRQTSFAVAVAVATVVCSDEASHEGAARRGPPADRLEHEVRQAMWEPVYRPIHPV
ncbi:MAG: oxaloacetate-decarboxylating malate dehydrogenase, partial [Acidimicrobiales bacterium]